MESATSSSLPQPGLRNRIWFREIPPSLNGASWEGQKLSSPWGLLLPLLSSARNLQGCPLRLLRFALVFPIYYSSKYITTPRVSLLIFQLNLTHPPISQSVYLSFSARITIKIYCTTENLILVFLVYKLVNSRLILNA